jgi:hypothetical protein
MWKRTKIVRYFPDVSKMTERRFKMILMQEEEAQCPYCEVWKLSPPKAELLTSNVTGGHTIHGRVSSRCR